MLGTHGGQRARMLGAHCGRRLLGSTSAALGEAELSAPVAERRGDRVVAQVKHVRDLHRRPPASRARELCRRARRCLRPAPGARVRQDAWAWARVVRRVRPGAGRRLLCVLFAERREPLLELASVRRFALQPCARLQPRDSIGLLRRKRPARTSPGCHSALAEGGALRSAARR